MSEAAGFASRLSGGDRRSLGDVDEVIADVLAAPARVRELLAPRLRRLAGDERKAVAKRASRLLQGLDPG